MNKPAKRRPVSDARVAKLWEQGKTIAEIAKVIGRFDAKGTDQSHGLRVMLTQMHTGFKNADGKIARLPHRISAKALNQAGRRSDPTLFVAGRL